MLCHKPETQYTWLALLERCLQRGGPAAANTSRAFPCSLFLTGACLHPQRLHRLTLSGWWIIPPYSCMISPNLQKPGSRLGWGFLLVLENPPRQTAKFLSQRAGLVVSHLSCSGCSVMKRILWRTELKMCTNAACQQRHLLPLRREKKKILLWRALSLLESSNNKPELWEKKEEKTKPAVL